MPLNDFRADSMNCSVVKFSLDFSLVSGMPESVSGNGVRGSGGWGVERAEEDAVVVVGKGT